MNLWTKQRSITHISYQMCCVALVKIWKERREEPACPCRQVVWVLSACPMTPIFPAPPSPTHIALVGRGGLPKSLGSSVHLWASLNWSRRLTTTGSIGCIKLIKVVGGRGHLCSHNARWKSGSESLSWLSENPPVLSAEVNKRRREWKQSKASLPNDL